MTDNKTIVEPPTLPLTCKLEDLVFIYWNDACATTARSDDQDIELQALAVNVNVGWIRHKDDIRTILCHGTSSSGERDYFLIPNVNIIKIERCIDVSTK